MKVVSTDGLTKLIQLSKDNFIDKNDVIDMTSVFATVATTGSYTDLTNKPTEIPSQSGQSGKFLTTNGSAVSWANTPTEIPTQSGQSGKFLTTNGTTVSWATVDALPSQTSQSGKFLTTNGTTASWANIPAELPSQSGQSGKFLTTNGTTVSWSPALVNESTGTDSLSILAGTISSDNNISIGVDAWGDEYTLAIGNGAYAWGNDSISIGHSAVSNNGSIAIGNSSEAITNAENSIVIGQGAAVTAEYSIQLGFGNCSESNAFYVGLSQTTNYKLLGSDGKIPDARLNNPIPSQTGNSGKFLTTNGTAVSWATVDALPSQTGQSGKYLTTNGTTASWADVVADSEIEWATYGTTTYQQISDWVTAGKLVLIKDGGLIYKLENIRNSGGTNDCTFKCLSGVNQTQSQAVINVIQLNGSNGNWSKYLDNYQLQLPAGTAGNIITYTGTAGSVGSATINDIVPTQSGNSGKFLTTNGSAVSWAEVDTLPSQSGHNGDVLKTNGTTASWQTSYAMVITDYTAA